MQSNFAMIFTDGSCHTQLRIGAWVAIILMGEHKIILSEKVLNTTHQRMELMAVIKGLQHIQQNFSHLKSVKIVSDSQYVVGLIARQPKLEATNFMTKANEPITNADWVKLLFATLKNFDCDFEKIKAHQKKTATINYNIEADKLSRKMVRDAVR